MPQARPQKAKERRKERRPVGKLSLQTLISSVGTTMGRGGANPVFKATDDTAGVWRGADGVVSSWAPHLSGVGS